MEKWHITFSKHQAHTNSTQKKFGIRLKKSNSRFKFKGPIRSLSLNSAKFECLIQFISVDLNIYVVDVYKIQKQFWSKKVNKLHSTGIYRI